MPSTAEGTSKWDCNEKCDSPSAFAGMTKKMGELVLLSSPRNMSLRRQGALTPGVTAT